VPRVRRLEYLLDFLQVVIEGYDREVAEQKLAKRKRWFESEKSRALGRGRQFMEKLKVAEHLTLDCLNMSLHLGLIQEREKPMLTDKGQALLTSNEAMQRRLLAQSFLQTYASAPHILVHIARYPSKEVGLPMERKNVLFVEKATPYGLKVGQTTFEVIRDLLSQLELMNWHLYVSDGTRYSKVYLTSNITSKAPPSEAGVEAVTFTFNGQQFTAVPTESPCAEFKQALWEEYLKLTKYVPRRPVFYSRLRSEVCYRLRVSDRVFDTYVKRIMQGDDTYLVAGSGGSLPYKRDSASLLKSLPVKSERGEYIVYLKMDVR